MNWKFIFVVYLKELKDQLRDRRTIISTIVIPTVVMPLIFFFVILVMTKIMKKAADEGTSVMVIGAAGAPQLMTELQADKKFRVLPEKDDYKQRIADKKMRVALQLPENFETRLQKGEVVTASILHYEGEIKSGLGVRELDSFLQKYRTKLVEQRLKERGLPVEIVKPYDIRRQNVAPPEKVGGAGPIGGFIPYIIIILCFVGAMYPAMDITAGEKERGTMETLMCSPAKRINIVLGKFLTVVTASVATMIFCLISMGVTVSLGGSYFTSKSLAASGGAATKAAASAMPTIDPAGVLGLFAMILPVAVLFAAILLTVSLFAKSYKEAQSYVGPLVMVVVLPAMFGMLPGIDLNLKTALVPILNLSLVSKEMLSGTWNWTYIGLIFASTSVYAGVALALCVKMFNREDVIFRA